MAACPTVTLALSLLLLISTKDCRGDEMNSVGLDVVKALKGVGVALGCVSDVTKESLQLHAENNKHLQTSLDIQRQNSDSLAAVGKLADEVRQIKEQLGQQREDTKHIKEELEDLHKAEKLARENEQLKLQVATEVTKAEKLALENEQLKLQVTTEVTKVENLEKQLVQTTLTCETQTGNVKRLNNTAEKLERENEQLKLKVATEVTKVKNLEKQLVQTELTVEIQTENEKRLNNTVAKQQRDLEVVRAENYQNILKMQDLENRLLAATNENKQNVMKVQDMDRKLNESLDRINQLEGKLTHVDQNVECQEETELKCDVARKHRITELMQEYNNTKNWNTVKRGLEAVLDKSSTAYKQLKSISYTETLPLYWVGRGGHKDLAELLVSCGRAVNIADAHGHTMLYGAAYSGAIGLARWLLDHCVNIEAGYEGGWTPLMNAAGVGQLEFVKLLVSAGANTAATNSQGHTALSWAQKNGRVLVVQYLSQLPH